MATTLLLSSPDNEFRGQDLGRVTLQCLHGLQSAITSLSVLQSIIDKSDHSNSTADVLGQFDAHVGDCSCHMRAQMIWRMIKHYEAPGRHEWIFKVIASMEEVQIKALSLLKDIKVKKGYMRALGFGTTVPYGQLFDRIGFTATLELLASSDTNSEFGGSDHSDDSNYSSRTLIDSGYQSPAQDKGIAVDDVTAAVNKLITKMPMTPRRTPSHSHRSVVVDEWDMDDHLVMLRFITFCRCLSVSKKATLEAGPPSMIRYRNDPNGSYVEVESILADKFADGDVKMFLDTVTPTYRAKKNILIKEHESMQVYVSTITADWLQNISRELNLPKSINRICSSSKVTNDRQVECVASWASILPIRADWLHKQTPIFVLIRRFCSQGYHNLFYRVTPNGQLFDNGRWATEDNLIDFGEKSWFNFEEISEKDTLDSSWASEPHFVFVSNSINGTVGDFYGRLVDENQSTSGPHAPHITDNCIECDTFANGISDINFSRLVMHFFGQHDQYPFDLTPGDSGHNAVASAVQKHLGETGVEKLNEARDGALEFGTGKNIHTFTFQHAYLELPIVIAEQAGQMLANGDKPAPFGYMWTN